MANDIPQGLWYDPEIYANEALIQLEKALGMATTVHRGYDKVPQERGSVIQIRRPGVFASADMPISTAADIDPDYDQITLDQWKGVVFGVSDKEHSESGQVIIDDHLRPAAFEMARTIDASLAALYKDVSYRVAATSGDSAFKDFTAVRRQFTDREVPNEDRWLMVGGEREEEYLNSPTFHRAQDAGAAAEDAQVRGRIGEKFGITTFVNQNTPTHVEGTAADGGDVAGLTNGTLAKGLTALVVDGFTGSETVLAGEIFTIAGHTRQYTVASDVTFSGGAGTLTISDPRGVESAVADGVVVTILVQGANGDIQNLAYHRNAFALAMAPLTTVGDGLGVQMATITDPVSQLALRSRIWYDAKEAKLYVGLDVLYGVKTLNPDLATRLQGPV